jgi:lipopolysaccharide/colanic/teichoic acid biosynthesis glycosyltransferase
MELTSPWLTGRDVVLKRAADVLIGFTLLLLLSPLLLAIGVAVAVSSPGPIFYGSQRWGRHGREFTMWKFRTMVADAHQLLQNDPGLLEEYKKNHKLSDDPRVTGLGRFLRRTSLDEIPQLWNVVVGEMSLVGPRPKLIGEEQEFGAAFATVLSVRPGITGLWQVSGRAETTYEERVNMDVHYVMNPSIWTDLGILARTPFAVIKAVGAH